LPGAKRIRKNEMVISTNNVGMASKIRFAMNLIINSTVLFFIAVTERALHPKFRVQR
jgi:hypothetical protein